MAYDPRFPPETLRPDRPGQPMQIDMTADGRFTRPPGIPLSTRVLAGAVLLAVVAGGLAMAALAIWVAMLLIPVAIVAVVVAVAAVRFKLWRTRRGAPGRGAVVRWP